MTDRNIPSNRITLAEWREKELTYVIGALATALELEDDEQRDALCDIREWAKNRLKAQLPDETTGFNPRKGCMLCGGDHAELVCPTLNNRGPQVSRQGTAAGAPGSELTDAPSRSPEEPPAECDHPRSELLARKGNQFEMRKCLDCQKVFRVRLPEKPPVKAGDPCLAFDATIHEAHEGKCMYCGAPMPQVNGDCKP